MAVIFTTLNQDQQVTAQIDLQIKAAATAQLNAYNAVRKLIYANPKYKNSDGTFNSSAVYAAYVANSPTGLTADQIGQMARLAKASLNLFQPNTVVDDVPQATITF